MEAKAFLERLRTRTGTPAVSAAVASNGRVIFSDGTGRINLELETPAAGGSVYNIGSVSKIITAAAVMQLVEQKRISLDDDIRKYVPAFPDEGSVISIRSILTHTSGIRHYRDSDFAGWPGDENILPVTNYLDGFRLFAADPLLFKPGEFFLYSSYAVNLLEGVIEKASGMSFEQYLTERVWRPASMHTASLDIPGRIVPHRASSYRREAGQLRNEYYGDVRYKFASGGMIASAEDLVRFGAAVNADILLGAQQRVAMFTPQLHGVRQFREGQPPAPIGFEQAMLWRIRTDPAGRRVAYHCGSVKAFNACLVDFIDEDLVAAVMTNSWDCCGWSAGDSLAAFFRPK